MSKVRLSRLMVDKPGLKNIKKPLPDDPQKWIVYRMEKELVGWAVYAHVDLEDLQRIADYMCRKAGVKRCGVVLENKGKQRIYGWTMDYTIHLNQDYHGDNTAVLVHELAHYVNHQLNGEDLAVHGPEFVGVYGWVLDTLNLFPYLQYVALCEQYGVEIDLTQFDTLSKK